MRVYGVFARRRKSFKLAGRNRYALEMLKGAW